MISEGSVRFIDFLDGKIRTAESYRPVKAVCYAVVRYYIICPCATKSHFLPEGRKEASSVETLGNYKKAMSGSFIFIRSPPIAATQLIPSALSLAKTTLSRERGKLLG